MIGSDRVELARITITKFYDEAAEGGESVYVDYGDDLSLVDALGMLAFAQATTFGTYTDDE